MRTREKTWWSTQLATNDNSPDKTWWSTQLATNDNTPDKTWWSTQLATNDSTPDKTWWSTQLATNDNSPDKTWWSTQLATNDNSHVTVERHEHHIHWYRSLTRVFVNKIININRKKGTPGKTNKTNTKKDVYNNDLYWNQIVHHNIKLKKETPLSLLNEQHELH
jgi:hypothetical protein